MDNTMRVANKCPLFLPSIIPLISILPHRTCAGNISTLQSSEDGKKVRNSFFFGGIRRNSLIFLMVL